MLLPTPARITQFFVATSRQWDCIPSFSVVGLLDLAGTACVLAGICNVPFVPIEFQSYARLDYVLSARAC